MNCKPGDVAMVVKDPMGKYTGNVLTVLRAADEGDLKAYPALQASVERYGLFWRVEHPGVAYAADSYLKPLRDSDEPDQTLEWLPVPGSEDSLRKTIDEKLWEMLK